MKKIMAKRKHVGVDEHLSGCASSPNPNGSGARAIGMGGAFIGFADLFSKVFSFKFILCVIAYASFVFFPATGLAFFRLWIS